MTERKPLYEVQMVRNEYHSLGENGGHHGTRPEWLYYCSGPGGPGPHGWMLQSEMYFDTHEQATAAIPMLTQAYNAGRGAKMREIKAALEI